MATTEIHVEMLLGRRVFAKNGKTVGRLEELVADLRKGECFVREFHLGSYALFERLAAMPIARVFLKLFGARKRYRIPWDRLDLSNPERPRLLCSIKELEPVDSK